MADTIRTTWIYPPNWNGDYPQVGGDTDRPHPSGWKRMSVQFTNVSDGTGESNVVKLDRDAFYGVQGLPCGKIGIERIAYNTYGMSVRLDWDMSPVQLVCMLPESSSGLISGPFYPDLGEDASYGVGETGDLLLTTIGHTANDSYTITMDILIKE